MKKLLIFLMFSVLFISCEPTKLADVNSVDDAKKRIDWVVNENYKVYNNLCSKPRNDDTKKKFNELRITLEEIYFAGDKCKNLDYKQQSEVTEYAISKIKANPSLYKLVDMGQIDCW